MSENKNGININLSKICSCITKFNFSTKDLGEKFKIRDYPLLGEDSNTLINQDYEDVLHLLFYGNLPNKKERIILDNKIKEAYDTDFSYQFKLLEENIKKFDSKPLILAEMLILSLTTLEPNSDEENLDYPNLFIQCFIVIANLFNKYVG